MKISLENRVEVVIAAACLANGLCQDGKINLTSPAWGIAFAMRHPCRKAEIIEMIAELKLPLAAYGDGTTWATVGYYIDVIEHLLKLPSTTDAVFSKLIPTDLYVWMKAGVAAWEAAMKPADAPALEPVS